MDIRRIGRPFPCNKAVVEIAIVRCNRGNDVERLDAVAMAPLCAIIDELQRAGYIAILIFVRCRSVPLGDGTTGRIIAIVRRLDTSDIIRRIEQAGQAIEGIGQRIAAAEDGGVLDDGRDGGRQCGARRDHADLEGWNLPAGIIEDDADQIPDDNAAVVRKVQPLADDLVIVERLVIATRLQIGAEIRPTEWHDACGDARGRDIGQRIRRRERRATDVEIDTS